MKFGRIVVFSVASAFTLGSQNLSANTLIQNKGSDTLVNVAHRAAVPEPASRR